DIDVQLTRRHDLVPQLVRTVQAYASHERQLLETVTELRAVARQLDQPTTLAEVEDRLEQTIEQVLLLSENYPDLKADQNFAQLQAELVEIENQLVYARRYYNGSVRDLNTRIEQFPDRLVARLFRFKTADFYQADSSHRPPVSMGQDSA
ncbi:MAG: LemA family protein, partial [Pseudomonadota bacterium]